MEKYENLGLVGEGSYGMVIKCRNKETGRVVAIKKFIDSEDDKHVKKIALREIRMLKQLRHDNLVNLLEVFRRKKRLYLVFEFVDHTILDDLEKFPNGIDELRTKRILLQVVRGVEFCHLHNIVHRDIKPENILVSRNGVVKLCDFGFARTLAAPGEVYTDYVATRWYRAPELLVGDTKYGRPIDIWAIGCLSAEMLTGDPLFPGDSDIDQLHRIVRCLGNLSEKYQNIFHRNPLFVGMRLPYAREIDPLDKRLAKVSQLTLGFIKSCLRIDANDRPTSSALLRSEYFTRDNFASIFLEELKNLIKTETEQNIPSSSTNTVVRESNTISSNNLLRNKNDPLNNSRSNIDNMNNDLVQSMTTATRSCDTDIKNATKLVKEKLTTERSDSSVNLQTDQKITEAFEKNKPLKIFSDNPTFNSNNTKFLPSEDKNPKSMVTEHANQSHESCEMKTGTFEYLVADENVDPQHLVDSMNASKQDYESNEVPDKHDDLQTKTGIPVWEKQCDRSNEMPLIPQKSCGLLTTIKCQSPKPVNSTAIPCIAEESCETLDETTISSTTLSVSPLPDNFVNKQQAVFSNNQSLFGSGFISKVTEVANEQPDSSSVVTEPSIRKPLDTKFGDFQSKELTSSKLLPYLTSTQANSHHFCPQYFRGLHQNPQKSLMTDDTNMNSYGYIASGVGVSSLSPLATYIQTTGKHDNRTVLQSTSFSSSTSIPVQSWTTQTSSSNASNSSKDSKSRRYYQPPNHRRSTFSLQFPMNISHSVSQPVSNSIGNHCHSHSHHFSVLHPIGIMPSPNMFEYYHEQPNHEQNDSRNLIGQVYFSSRSPLQSLSQQNIFKKSLSSSSTTGITKQENAYSVSGNQHSFSPQILPVVTSAIHSINQYNTNFKSINNNSNNSSNNNQFPLSRLRNSDKFWLGSLPRR